MTPASAVNGRHTAAALAVTAAAIAVYALGPDPSPAVRALVLAALVAGLGLPHGAVDHLEGRALLAPYAGRAWWLVFGGLYVGAAALVVAAWLAWPPGLLTGFLLLAIGHFGAEDVAAGAIARSRAGRTAEAVVRGAIPVLGPILAHPERTAVLFAHLLPAESAGRAAPVLTMLAAPAPGALAVVVGLIVMAAWRRRGWLALELAALTATVWVLPPLLAFVVYFCLWHAPRHTLTVAARLAPRAPERGLIRFARAAWPLTIATIAGGALAWWWLAAAAGAVPAAVATVFVGLAALTVPHVILAACHARSEAA